MAKNSSSEHENHANHKPGWYDTSDYHTYVSSLERMTSAHIDFPRYPNVHMIFNNKAPVQSDDESSHEKLVRDKNGWYDISDYHTYISSLERMPSDIDVPPYPNRPMLFKNKATVHNEHETHHEKQVPDTTKRAARVTKNVQFQEVKDGYRQTYKKDYRY